MWYTVGMRTKHWTYTAFLTVIFFGMGTYIPYLLTSGQVAADGQAVMGFPFVFRTEGGFCAGPCGYFSVPVLLIDLALCVALAWCIVEVLQRVKRI